MHTGYPTVVAAAVLGLILALGPGPAMAQTAKPRSSSPNGIEVRPDAPPAPAAAMMGGGDTAPLRGGGVTPAASGAAVPAGAPPAGGTEGAGGVSISGSSSTSGTLSGGNDTSVGQGNSGCTNVGSISGRRC